MRDVKQMRVAGVAAIAWVVVQLIGNLLHPSLPRAPDVAMSRICDTPWWGVAHLILMANYFVLIPFGVGLAASFAPSSRLMSVAIPLLVVAIAIGVVQVAIHPTMFHVLAQEHMSTTSANARDYIVMMWDAVFSYNVAMEVGHMLVLFAVIGLASGAMFGDGLFPRWLSWLGIVGSVVAAVATVVGAVVLDSSMFGNYITFGVGLAPLAVWLVAVGIVLLRFRPTVAPALVPA